jgi:hypothetical protein
MISCPLLVCFFVLPDYPTIYITFQRDLRDTTRSCEQNLQHRVKSAAPLAGVGTNGDDGQVVLQHGQKLMLISLRSIAVLKKG